MVLFLLKVFLCMLLGFGILCIFSVVFTFFTAAWESVKEDEKNGVYEKKKKRR